MKFSNKIVAADTQALVVVGEVLRPHALRGVVKVKPLTDWPERFKDLTVVSCLRQGRVERELRIDQAVVQNGAITIKFQGIDDRTAAEALTGTTLAIPRHACISLPAGESYIFEIIGLKIVNPRGEEVGTLADVFSYPAHDVWSIRKGGKEVLIPATEDFVKKIDRAAGCIVVDRIEEFED